ncbi:hypothetical protein CesoFtcFv8_004823 [Champsocephalus esox]|uniref:Uncharacterized protein n=1 Tax=Champsocephalus esox TaxID=159716 RepID=A0AAN8CNY3_9TELE|nr:hypothetical protein CesoFtcFv8_004823 [Champsocephalus esox]
MTETTIQLPEVNVATVTQWLSRRCRSQEQQVLKQGIPAPDAPMAGPEQLLVAKQKGTSLFPGSLAEPHAFVLPSNTAGEAKLQKRSQPVAISQGHPPPPYYALPFLAPTPPFSTPYMMVPSVQLPQVPGPSQVVPGSSQIMILNMPFPLVTQALTSGQSNVPYTTQQNRERKEEREPSGSGKGKYVKKTDAIICRLPNTLESYLVLTTCSVRLDGLFESSLIPRRLRTCCRMWMKAVDDSGMAGMDRVDSLAECLVELRNLTNQQVSCSVAEPAGL